MRTTAITCFLGGIYGVAMAAAGVDYKHPAFWIGMAFGVLMGINQFLSEEK